jgi:fructose-bisphosphate aldolase class II
MCALDIRQQPAALRGQEVAQSPRGRHQPFGGWAHNEPLPRHGQSGDKEDGHGAEGKLTKEMRLTDPDEAARFVEARECDALAIAIGTSHGAYKFTRQPTGEVLAISRVKEIHARLPNTHLVMHGSSSVPQDLLAEIRDYGGDIRETYGVPVDEICEGIRHGVHKVNIDTDIRLAMTTGMRRVMATKAGELDPRKFLQVAMDEAQKVCTARFEAFGSAGQASNIRPIVLDRMAQIYASGELRPQIH